MSNPTYICDLCGHEFDIHAQCTEHLVEEHQIFTKYIRVDDPANQEPL